MHTPPMSSTNSPLTEHFTHLFFFLKTRHFYKQLSPEYNYVLKDARQSRQNRPSLRRDCRGKILRTQPADDW